MYKNKIIKDIGSLYIALAYTYTILDVRKPSIKIPYNLLKDIYVEEVEDELYEDQLEILSEEEVTAEMYFALIEALESALDYQLFVKQNSKGCKMILALKDYVKEIGCMKLELEALAPSEDNSKAFNLNEANKIVQDFLNGPWIKTLLVKRIGILKNSSKVVPETFGLYDTFKNTACAILEEDKAFAYMNRTSAIAEWFAKELSNYNKYLKGLAGATSEDLEAADFLSDLLTGIGRSKNDSTERDWAEGSAVFVTFTGLNLPGVALKVDSVHFSTEEILYMATQIDALNQLANKADGLCNTPDELYYGKNICVKLEKLDDKSLATNKKLNTYDLSLLNMDRPADALVKQVKTILEKPEDERPEVITGLFYGIPGSGKSLLANYLAKKLNRPIIKKTYADLQSMYVGEGEKNLSDAFREAEAEGAILLIDEIDSIAVNRSKADKNYQKTFTNQLLTELDEFKGIFLATSNSMESLDSAVLRRLFLKVKFDFLNEEQVETAFKLYFPKLKRSKLGYIKYLTPGDFKAVKEAAQFDEQKLTVKRVRELLQNEVDIKKLTLNEVIGSEKTVGYHL